MSAIRLRQIVRDDDGGKVRRLVAATGKFYPEEIDVAEELVLDRLNRGPASGYEFLWADADGYLAGYVCYGRISMTQSSWDLYWIAVEPDTQGQGIGSLLLRACEQEIGRAGGGQVYVETSGRPDYHDTRAFYRSRGYEVVARLENFYAPGDAKVVFCKRIAADS